MLVLGGLVALCSLAGIVAGDKNEDCYRFHRDPNFNQSQYMGKWYQHRGFHENLLMECIEYNWFYAQSGHIQLDSSAFYLNGTAADDAFVDHTLKEPGLGVYKLTSQLSGHSLDRYVILTDYTSYGIEYDCVAERPSLRIVTRDPNPSKSVTEMAMRYARSFGFNVDDYRETRQDCVKVSSNQNKHPRLNVNIEIII